MKSNGMASTVSHAENCLYDILQEINENGTLAQKVAISEALAKLETLYFTLREDE